jgi:hypothetical protein
MMLLDLYWKDKRNGLEIGYKNKDKHKQKEVKVIILMIKQKFFINKSKVYKNTRMIQIC